MIRVGHKSIEEKIQFDSYDEAYTYAREHNLDPSEIEDNGYGFEIDRVVDRTYQSKSKKQKSSDDWKTRVADKLGDYTGEGYVVKIFSTNPKYYTGKKSLQWSTQLSDAQVYHYEKDAKKASRYGDASIKGVLKVQIKNGKIIKVLSR